MPWSDAARRNALVVMAKYPSPGLVKTRLARDIGAEAAARLYAAFLRDLEARLQGHGQPWALHWAYAPAEADFAALVEEGCCLAQRGADLGSRLINIFRDVWLRGYRRVVVVSSDSPHLPTAWAREAFTALATHDVVLGPADDGGYYLIGLRGQFDLFDDISWSTDAVLQQTLERAERLRLSIHLLPPTFDVDAAADLAKVTEWLRASAAPDELPHTRRALASIARQAPGAAAGVGAASPATSSST